MVQQYRQVIATAPDGLAMMGTPATPHHAYRKLAQQQGVLTEYVNVDVPDVRAAFGGGYVGAVLYNEGLALGMASLKDFGLKEVIRRSCSATFACLASPRVTMALSTRLRRRVSR